MRAATIAIVDDDSRVLESLENLLESAGYHVRPFASSAAVLEPAELMQVDCLISDVCMPSIDGLELQRQVGVRRPELPVILMSARSESQAITGANGHQACLFSKPFNSRELLAAVAVAVGN
jgi:FixJ family two-component response regulator